MRHEAETTTTELGDTERKFASIRLHRRVFINFHEHLPKIAFKALWRRRHFKVSTSFREWTIGSPPILNTDPFFGSEVNWQIRGMYESTYCLSEYVKVIYRCQHVKLITTLATQGLNS